jgi:uncharacterized membrane protein YdbT with pleckstrin-like domain
MTKSNSTSGVGVYTLLGIAFIILKLCNIIDWSWWWVTLPFWGGLAIFLAFGLIFGIVWLIITLIKVNKNKRNFRKKHPKFDKINKNKNH